MKEVLSRIAQVWRDAPRRVKLAVTAAVVAVVAHLTGLEEVVVRQFVQPVLTETAPAPAGRCSNPEALLQERADQEVLDAR